MYMQRTTVADQIARIRKLSSNRFIHAENQVYIRAPTSCRLFISNEKMKERG